MNRWGMTPRHDLFPPNCHQTSLNSRAKLVKILGLLPPLFIYGVLLTHWMKIQLGWGYSKEHWWVLQQNGTLSCLLLCLVVFGTWLMHSLVTSSFLSIVILGQTCCYSGFHHSRWITLCMAFPCPAADSLDPMDHFLSFDVSLIIPTNIWKMIYTAFNPISAYIRGFDH